MPRAFMTSISVAAGLGLATALATPLTTASAAATTGTPEIATITGTSGSSGTSGTVGRPGTSGTSGSSGTSDTSDTSGTSGSTGTFNAAGEGPVRLVLPAPSVRRSIGTVALRLVDRSRRDPLVTSRPYRELMVSLWYPAAHPSARFPLAPHMAPRAAADWDVHSAPGLEIPPGTVNWAATRTHARLGAPVDRRAGALPVVLFASGDGGPRSLGTVLVEELAARGYLVVTVDHTFEADQVEFPGGRVERAAPLPGKLTPKAIDKLLRKHARVRLADMRFVLDRLADLGRGRGPDASPLPAGLTGAPDLSRVGMVGQSLGGSVAAQLAHDDRRVDAAVNLDGSYVGPVARTGVSKPFLALAAGAHTRRSDPTWRSFWTASRGWKRELRFAGAGHGSFTDLQVILPQLAAKSGKIPSGDLIGTIAPARSVAAQRAYVTAFFELHLKGRSTPLFTGPTPRHPDVKIIP
ncbi:esterase [Sphaerisporangium siamense]|uniref:Dienelactone hydrolase n=1 Tax=Sphaerisporangium siamense TaxID=795645 RepID=A0A7W7DEG3_9ACTN|nr:lipase [Sphaerisporangium siamense]MBB4705272.1 dienelactone hydrolase [Sphaerisporangium siamense]GII86576.1 esterase [Sphaerisporangium siamense]